MSGKSCCSPSRERSGNLGNPALVPAKKDPRLDTAAMRLIPGGEFLMGTEDADGWLPDGEGPIRAVTLRPFYMDACCVTNREFNEFVRETGFTTEAEHFGWSFVFYLFLSPKQLAMSTQRVVANEWWRRVDGANWRHPEGPDSGITKRWDHPVVHVSWNDAVAYCHWSGKRLPTEAEWECAARGGLVQKRYAWGDELTPGGRHMCNIWQGVFPTHNTAADGFVGTAPVKTYKTNGYGLYNVAGNVWEWCHDWFSADFHVSGLRVDPVGPPVGERKVVRGGSYLCHASYCNRYRVGARTGNTPDSSSGNTGFRCALDL